MTGIDAGATTRTEEVYEVLRTDLLTGLIAPGERLKVVEVSTRFGVSQSVVREVLTRLAEKDLVIATPQRGFRVRELSINDVQALAEARAQIESLTLRLAIERGDIHWETGVLATHHLLESTPLLLADGQCNAEWVARHQAFHRALLSGCGNPRLEEVCMELRDCGELYRQWYRQVPDYGSQDVATEHRLLKDLAMARQTDAALALLRTHIECAPMQLVAYAAAHGTA